jgi:ABC-type transporter Mla subunit MlaD
VAVHLVELVEETQTLVHQIRAESGLTDTIRNANGFVVDMRDQGKELKSILKKLNVFADSLEETGKNAKRVSGEGGNELTALLKELRDTNRELQKRVGSVEGQLSKTLDRADHGFSEAEGFVKGLRTLMSSNEEQVSSLLRHLNETSRNVEGMSADLRAHPWKVVWKEDGSFTVHPADGTDQWRDRGRIGPFGKE